MKYLYFKMLMHILRGKTIKVCAYCILLLLETSCTDLKFEQIFEERAVTDNGNGELKSIPCFGKG